MTITQFKFSDLIINTPEKIINAIQWFKLIQMKCIIAFQ